jgi:hypothetical protein
MKNKPGKSLAKDPRNVNQAADADRSRDEGATTKSTLRPVREGPENLRQRAEWFRRRSGEK